MCTTAGASPEPAAANAEAICRLQPGLAEITRDAPVARIAAAEDLGMPPVGQLEDPEFCFLMYQPEAEDVLVEMRQFPGVTCSRAAPSKTRDLHACQYHHHQGTARQHPRMRILPAAGWCPLARACIRLVSQPCCGAGLVGACQGTRR